jgi:hypothetical protein
LAQEENALPNQFLYLKVVNFEVSTMSQDSPEQGTLKILVVDDGLNPLLICLLAPLVPALLPLFKTKICQCPAFLKIFVTISKVWQKICALYLR